MEEEGWNGSGGGGGGRLRAASLRKPFCCLQSSGLSCLNET